VVLAPVREALMHFWNTYERCNATVRTENEMPKTLTKTGNSLALILDRPLLEQTGIDEKTPLEISTDGDVISIDHTINAAQRDVESLGRHHQPEAEAHFVAV